MVSLSFSELANGDAYNKDGRLQSVRANPKHYSGYLFEVIHLNRGLSVVTQDFSLYGEGAVRLVSSDDSPPYIAFFTSLSGVRHASYRKPRAFMGDGCANIECSGYETSRYMEVNSNEPVQVLTVCMTPEIFTELTGRTAGDLAESLDRADSIAGRKPAGVRSAGIDMAQRICGYQAFDCFRHRPGDILYLEAKALELAALQLRQLKYITGEKTQYTAAETNRGKICYACEILKNEMMNPPGKLELARRTGLNHNQLVSGFKEMLGVCPFEYLRILRLDRAYELISSGECNVTEAAFSVGYSSLSHFTKTFREKFGIPPKAVAGKKNIIF